MSHGNHDYATDETCSPDCIEQRFHLPSEEIETVPVTCEDYTLQKALMAYGATDEQIEDVFRVMRGEPKGVSDEDVR